MEPNYTGIPSSSNVNRKRWFVLGGIGAFMVLVILAITFTRSNTNQTTPQAEKLSPAAAFQVEPAGTAPRYVTSSVYDACSLVSFKTMRSNIPNFNSLLNTIGSAKDPAQPVVVQHEYIDRSISEILGSDGQGRSPSFQVGEPNGSVNANSFMSLFDSSCAYGQAKNQSFIPDTSIANTFAKLHITQRPTPLSNEFVNYVTSLQKDAALSLETVEVYVEPGKDANGFFTTILMKSNHTAAAIFKTGIEELRFAASKDIAQRLSQEPAGPLSVIYPDPYKAVKNACELITSADFEQFTAKKASPLAQERLLLTETEGDSIKRECVRLEVDRDILNSNIASSKVVLRLAKNSEVAKQIIKREQASGLYTLAPLKAKIALGDEAYIKTNNVTTDDNLYEFQVRTGALIIDLQVERDQRDASAQAFENRMISVARSVLDRLAAAGEVETGQ